MSLPSGSPPSQPTDHGLHPPRWSARLLDGDLRWGSMDRSVTRYGVTRFRLVVYPPGIDDTERRVLRAWRAWPTWGVAWWLLGVCLCAGLTSWARFALPTSVWLGIGAYLFTRVGALRKQVRTLRVTRIAGDPDPKSTATYAEMNALVTMLRSADRRLERGESSPAGHEATWWEVHDRLMHYRVNP